MLGCWHSSTCSRGKAWLHWWRRTRGNLLNTQIFTSSSILLERPPSIDEPACCRSCRRTNTCAEGWNLPGISSPRSSLIVRSRQFYQIPPNISRLLHTRDEAEVSWKSTHYFQIYLSTSWFICKSGSNWTNVHLLRCVREENYGHGCQALTSLLYCSTDSWSTIAPLCSWINTHA
jgi:hypothetical protein